VSVTKGTVQRLRKAGVIKKGDLPDEYRDVLETLSEREILLLIDLYEDLAEAEKKVKRRKSGKPLLECFIPL
jgi:hypothetical protein